MIYVIIVTHIQQVELPSTKMLPAMEAFDLINLNMPL